MQPNDPTNSTDNSTNPESMSTPTNPELESPNATTEPTTTPTVSETQSATTPAETTPQAATVTMPSATPPPAEKKSFLKSKKAKLVALVAGLVVVLGGGGAAAYYGLVLPNQPQRIAEQAISNTLNQEKVASGSFEGEVAFSGGDIANTLSSISFNGSSSDKGAVSMTLTANTAVTKINLDVRSTDGKSIYARLSGLDGLDKLLAAYAGGASADESAAMVSALAPIITKLNNQWYSIDESMLGQLSGSLGVAGSDSKVSEADAKKIGDIYRKHQFIQIDKKLADEKIHDVNSYHIQAKLNKDQLVAFLNELKAANISSLPIDQSMIDEIAKVDFSKYPFDMWVSKSDRVLTQLATKFEEEGTTVNVRVALFDLNKEVKVEAPTDAKSVLELLSEFAPLYGGLMSGESQNASDTPLDLNMQ